MADRSGSDQDSSQHCVPARIRVVVDAVIGRFEKALSAGLEPRVEEFLQCEARDAHPAILHYLLPAEFEHRQPPIDAWEADYIRRLPEYEQDIRAVCRQLRRQSPTAIEPRVPAFPDPEASKAPEQIPILQLRNANEFQNVAYLAKGGYSFVYRADWISDDRQIPVVLKLGIKKHGKPDPASIAEVQKRLNHPNIARFLGVTEDVADNQILIEEFIAGPTLSGFLKETRDQCPIKDVLNWMLKIVAAVEYMHAQGIYHFDLKPANILGFVTGQIEPRIADFGAAVLWENLHIDFTRYFTHAYSAPEQLIAGDRRPGPRCDIFALGVILYQLLTKKLPFGGDDEVSISISKALAFREANTPVPPRSHRPEIPAKLNAICLKCLQFRPEDRYSSAKDLLEALQSLESSPNEHSEAALLQLSPLTAQDHTFYHTLLKAIPNSSLATQIQPLLRRILPPEDANSTAESPRILALSGPSGAGKSTWFAAGVLPTLREGDHKDAVTVVMLNAEENVADASSAAESTAEKLRQLLIYRLSLPRTTDTPLGQILSDWIAASDDNSRRPLPARKLLIVIDQFEQWLSVHGSRNQTQLQQALKLCDGHLVQALLIFRSDFIDRAEKFMRDCDSRRADGSSGFSIDPLTGDEAATILDHVLSTPGAASRWSQESDRQNALQYAGKLLSDAAKRHGGVCPAWVVMVAKFLIKHASDPLQLQHQRSLSDVALSHIRGLLEGPAGSPPPQASLYPDIVRCLIDDEAGGDLRRQVSFDQFHSASLKGTTADGLQQALQSFEKGDLIIHMQVNTAGRQEAVWQLTHEIWIQPLRQWLEHIPRTKAESLLANRTAAWIKSGESRHLLSTGELVQVVRIVPAERRSQDQTKFLRRSVVHVSQNWLLKFIVPGILLITVLAQALRLGELIGQSGTASISSEITGAPFYLRAYVRNRLTKELQNRRQSASSDPRLWLGVQIALLKLLEPTDPLFQQESQRLLEGLPTTPTEFRTEILHYIDVAAAEIRKVNGKFLDQQFREAQIATTGNDLKTAASMLADHAWISFLLNQPEQVNRTLGQLPDRSAIAVFTTRLEEWLSVDGVDKRLLQQNAALDPGILMVLLPAIGDSKRPSTALQEVVRIYAQSNLAHVRRTAQRIAKRWMPDERFPPHPEWYLMPIGDQELCFLKVSIPHTTPAAQLYVLETEVPWAIVKSLLPEIHEREGKPDLDLPAGGLTASEMIKICNMLSEKFEFVKVYEPTGEAREWKRKDKANGFRLPTEVEFFYFALGSAHRQPANTSYRYMGDSITDDLYYSQLKKYANVQGSNVSSNGVNNSSRVGSLRANAVGLYDTLGNVSEVNWPSEKSTANEDFYTNGGDYENDIGLTTLKPDISGRGMPIFIDHDSGTDTVGFRIVRDASP